MKKRTIMSLTCATVALALTACSTSTDAQGGSDGTTDPDEKITLTIGSAMVTEDPEGAVEQEIAQRYMDANPNVTIEFISMPATEISKRVVTQAATGDLPDMFFVPTDFMPQLHDLEITADLEGLLGEEYLAGYNQALLEDAKVDGKMVTVPIYASPYAVIYRADWFKDLGLTPPATWDEFRDVAKALTQDTDNDGNTDQWGFSMVGSRNNSGETRFALISKSFGADEVYEKDGGWASDVATPEFQDALKLFTDLALEDGVVPPGPVEVDYSMSMELFTGEQTGMILSGPHSLGFITKQNPDLDGKLGSFLIPKGPNGEHVSISGLGGYTITEASKSKDVAADYLKFFTNEENALYFGEKTGRMPVRSDAAEAPLFSTELFTGFLEAMDYNVPTKTFPAYPALLDAIGEAYSNVLSGAATLDQANQTLDSKVQDLLASQ